MNVILPSLPLSHFHYINYLINKYFLFLTLNISQQHQPERQQQQHQPKRQQQHQPQQHEHHEHAHQHQHQFLDENVNAKKKNIRQNMKQIELSIKLIEARMNEAI
jgi:hypothetical protein